MPVHAHTPAHPTARDALLVLEVLVVAAGTNIPEPLVDVTDAHLDQLLDLNVRATFVTLQAVARRMVAAGGGSIVLLSSQMGHVGAPHRAVYCASKHAVEGLAKASAVELAPHGVRVNTVCPGLVPNAMGAQLAVDMERLGLFPSVDEAVGAVVALTPSGRLATEDDIANGVAFLLSEDAAFINGVTLSIDGAMGM